MLASLVLMLTVTAGGASASPGRYNTPAADQRVTYYCDYKTCTFYWARSYTKNVLAPAASGGSQAFIGLMTAMCAPGGFVLAGICGASSAAVAGVSTGAIAQAAAQNQCAAYVSDNFVQVGYFRTDNSVRCKD